MCCEPDKIEHWPKPKKSEVPNRFGFNRYHCCRPTDALWSSKLDFKQHNDVYHNFLIITMQIKMKYFRNFRFSVTGTDNFHFL